MLAAMWHPDVVAYTIDELIGVSLAAALPRIRAKVPPVINLIAQTESTDTPGRVNLYLWVVSTEHLSEPQGRMVEKLVGEALSNGQFSFLGVTPYFFFQTKAEREQAGYTT